MEYKNLISITGMGGLYEMVSSKTDGAIVKSLEDGTTKFISSRIHQFSHLESIEVYTVNENVNLTEVLLAMQKSKEAKPDAKDAAAVKKYFETVYKEMDFDKVYNSDMKKMVKWLEVLEKNKIEIKSLNSESTEVEESENATETTTEKPKKEVKEKKEISKTKNAQPKATIVKNAPAKKITSPRKMA